MKVKVNDQIIVITGKDRTKVGKVLHTLSKKNRIIVEGVNIIKKHVKPKGNNKGGIISQEASINVSNVKIICPSCTKAIRAVYHLSKTGVKERVCNKCKQPLDQVTTSKK